MQSSPVDSRDGNASHAARQGVMALMARAERGELDGALARLAPVPAASDLKPPEVGLVMLRGRTGGDGAPFNLGEATVARAAIRLEGGASGFAYRLGRDVKAARTAAILDALWQDAARRGAVEEALAPLRARLSTEAATVRAETAATKVDFFTLVRGED
ncbi:phosphonate C-P lyase system protein PhnG [Ancylobacter dichloromethanicus]|uniref:Phosphonate metabolism protein PhnG n=1 Tax=Ancylobacter dichloromethanicus TaxID=518825 RepID=A0A9W6JA78_9HYPH|nr:phosphonate C-P lyase system protein PhnG [Ancylobacter dichloromethanicus]MBS7553500.1 phosphonate C-P lyase system protein PhnG [Ancylobacter dichloromethanicus]GLK72558.1 phosphonate metabolism protein PhnG [Ancylobacter dichloromethanicus]